MYCTVMGDAFHRLAVPIQQFHTLAGHHTLHGEVAVTAPASLLAKALAVLLGSPLKSQQGSIRFDLDAQPTIETWTRHFPGKTMRSTLEQTGNRVTERLGAALLVFALSEVEGALEMQLEAMRFLGIPCPKWLMPRIVARETGALHKLHFHIQASVPLIGRVVSYTGYLHIPQGVCE